VITKAPYHIVVWGFRVGLEMEITIFREASMWQLRAADENWATAPTACGAFVRHLCGRRFTCV